MSAGIRLWGLRLLALAIAGGLWFGVALSNREAVAEKTVEAAVSYIYPSDMVILNQVPSVRVRVSGPEGDIRRLAPFQVQAQVNLEGRGPGRFSIGLGPDNVVLPDGVKALSLEPNVLALEVDRKVTRILPLQASFTGEPAAGARALVDRVKISPAQATVTGPSRLVNNLSSLDLSPINLDGHALSFEESATVLTPDPLVQVDSKTRVLVQIPMDLGDAARGSGDSGGAFR